MEKSVKNAVFKGFPVLMESDTFGSKQGQAAYLPSLFSIYSQLSTKIKKITKQLFERILLGTEVYQKEKSRQECDCYYRDLALKINHNKSVFPRPLQ